MLFKEAYSNYNEYMQMRNKVTSVRDKQKKFKNYILPYFENMQIEDITPIVYLKWQEKINKTSLSDTFKESLHYAMASMYSYLELFWNYDKNIPKMVGCFKSEYIPHEIKFWTLEEYKTFINTFDKYGKEYVYKCFYDFLFFTGCRLGEANALTFADLTNDLIFINKTITKDSFNGERLIQRTKTIYSTRKIKIDNTLIQEIKTLKEIYKAQYDDFNKDFFVFGGKIPLSPTTIERIKNTHCDIANVKRIRIHDFRHSHATLLLKNHVPLQEISSRLGHSDINITIKTYTHLVPEYEKNVMNILNSLHSSNNA